jgi:hypothetical protein
VMATDSSGKNLGGLAAGIGLGLLHRSFIWWYKLYKYIVNMK